MTTLSTHSRTLLGAAATIAAVRAKTACKMRITETEVTRAMMLSAWHSIDEMMEREFLGAYRGYTPKCSMAMRAEAVIAEVFDTLAIELGDERRAMRSDAWAPPAPAGGETRHG